jgi:hydrogenase-1 operon protein HyaE
MSSVLIRKLYEEYGYPLLDQATLEPFLAANDDVVLFFSERPENYPEANDVAVILPELMKQFEGRLRAAVIAPGSQHNLQKRYGFLRWPALVFLRHGEYLGAITQMKDWSEYLIEIERLLDSEPTRAPGIGVPVVEASA